MSTLKIREDSTSPWQSIPTGGVGVPAGGTSGQFVVKSSSTDYATQWVTVTPATIGAMAEWDLLWENASPTSDFASQSVSIDFSGYDFAAIIFRDFALNDTYGFDSVISCIGEYAALTIVGGTNTTGRRRANVQSTGVTFDATKYAGSTSNAYAVPYYIYGIKGVNNS